MFTVPKGTKPNKDNIEKAIEYNEKQRSNYNKLDDYYRGKHEIVKRFKKSGLKNNKVVINHARFITDINVGYLLGNQVEYHAEENIDISLVLEEYKKQTIADLDNEVAKAVSKFGKAYELTYADENNNVKSKLIDPRNCIIIYDDTVEHNPVFAITYKSRKNKNEYEDVITYTESEWQEWGTRLGTGTRTPHQFGIVPIVEYRNNPEEEGDYACVISLIDAYNTLQSDRINDKEQLVEAILVLYGMDMTREQKEDLRETRVMTAPSQTQGAKVEYLVKAMNETDTDVLRSRIEADIHKISMTPNLTDENFVGNASGVAIRYKLIAFEQSIVNKERYFEKGLKARFKLYNNYLKTLRNMAEVELHKVDAVFKRNLPQNDLETSQIVNNLDGYVSRQTLVEQVSFVDDAKKELEIARDEAQERAQALADQFGTMEPSQEENEDE